MKFIKIHVWNKEIGDFEETTLNVKQLSRYRASRDNKNGAQTDIELAQAMFVNYSDEDEEYCCFQVLETKEQIDQMLNAMAPFVEDEDD